MRVLFVSPIDPKVPKNLKFLMGGENTYTKTLLENPPPGVEYVHHLDALQAGEVRFGKLQVPLKMLVKFRILPLSAGTVDLELRGGFDLVHCHAYTLRLRGRGSTEMPVVLGDSIPNRWGLSNYFHQHPARIAAAYRLRNVMHQALGVYDQDLSLGKFSKLIVMSEFAKREHVRLGADQDKIAVVYPGLPDRSTSQQPRSGGVVRILFAGVWFERKGGMILWEAYKRVREKLGKKVGLTILGPLSETFKYQTAIMKHSGIVQHDFVPYSQLLEDFYPKAHIFVHVPPKAEGYGLVVQEAMSFGIPVVASRLGALPEMVKDGKTGILVEPGRVEDLAEALVRLVEDSRLRTRLGRAGRRRFLSRFSLAKMHRKLEHIYSHALREAPSR